MTLATAYWFAVVKLLRLKTQLIPSDRTGGLKSAHLQVHDLDVAPSVAEVLGHQAPVAMMRLVLTAEETGIFQLGGRQRLLDSPGLHQRDEAPLIGGPVCPVFPVRVEDLLGRCKLRSMDVVDPADRLQKVAQVVLLCEGGELGTIVEPHINNSLYAGAAQSFEERLRRGLGEAYREDSHLPFALPTSQAKLFLLVIDRSDPERLVRNEVIERGRTG